MIYKNKKTGAIIDSPCICGGDWAEEKQPKATKQTESKEVKPKKGGD